MKYNIPKSVNDMNYRYKRDEIQITNINSNGGNTKLNNLIDISEQLNDNINNIIKFMKKKLSVGIITNKTEIIINKSETKDNLENILEDYIKKFIICPNCNNPEFDIIKKTQTRTCKACGFLRTNL